MFLIHFFFVKRIKTKLQRIFIFIKHLVYKIFILGKLSNLHERTNLHEGTKLHEDTFARGHFCLG